MTESEMLFWLGNGIVSFLGLLLGFGQLLTGYTAIALLMFCIPLLSLFNVCMWVTKDATWLTAIQKRALIKKLLPR